jgi:hypothetical protein
MTDRRSFLGALAAAYKYDAKVDWRITDHDTAHAAFYSYAYPEPAGFSQASIKPAAAFYSADLREFILPYDAVRESESPDNTLLEFLQATYEAAADLSNWDRQSLERSHDPKRLIQPEVGRPG